MGASRAEQVAENLQALSVVSQLTEDVMKKIDGVNTQAAEVD
jgi:aryl-alcohol dehydrogenase-like predicted oxidoreductase